MKNKIITICLFTVSGIVFAHDHSYTSQEDLNKQVKNYLQSQNLPLPDSGIQIISGKELFASQATKNKDFQMLNEQRKNGYVKADNSRAKELMELHNTATYQYQKFANNYSPT